MGVSDLIKQVGNTDIYVLDQIMKGRYQAGESILDAGCGEGRNLVWFYQNGFEVYGVDTDAQRLEQAKQNYPNAATHFVKGNLDKLPYDDAIFNHIICSAVLHFAKDETHFQQMLSELIRVLKPAGTLLIRVASNIGLDGRKPHVREAQTNREGTFYITRPIIQKLVLSHPVDLIAPIKTTNVQDERAMTTLVLCKG